MAKDPQLRFDHREIAVIFSLFVFVSLLMFTVGIVVGKGIAQAKYEAILLKDVDLPALHAPQHKDADSHGAPHQEAHGGALAPIEAEGHGNDADKHEDRKPAENHDEHGAKPAEGAQGEAGHGEAAHEEKPKAMDLGTTSLKEAPKHAKDESDLVMKNPKVKQLFDEEPAHKPAAAAHGAPAKKEEHKATGHEEKAAAHDAKPVAHDAKPAENHEEKKEAAHGDVHGPKEAAHEAVKEAPKKEESQGRAPASRYPQSLAKGKFTVQVGSYPTEKDAAERVEMLKQKGFRHSYFTTKEIGDKKEIWYRVWLGYYPDLKTAQQSGEMLQKENEIKNFLVRKADGEQ